MANVAQQNGSAYQAPVKAIPLLTRRLVPPLAPVFVASNWQLEPLDAPNDVIGRADIALPTGMILRQVLLRRSRTGEARCVRVPAREFKAPDGISRTFVQVVEFASPEAWMTFNRACLKAFEKLLATLPDGGRVNQRLAGLPKRADN
jgi:hypothetical protein